MTSWNLDKLRSLVENLHGSEQKDCANLHINAVDWKLRTAGYHLRAATSGLDVVTKLLNTVDHPLKVFLTDGDNANTMYENRHIYEANIIAAAQNIHSVSDIIAHVIYDCLNLNGIEQHEMNLKAVKAKLPASNLKQSVVAFLGRADFRYLQDFTNTIKHLNLVQTISDVDLELPPYKYEVNLKEFSYKGRNHSCKTGAEFSSELKQMTLAYICLGKKINGHLETEVC